MLGYLSKFVLQMLPTISATVIGAYIVATWINPKTPPEPAKVAARQQAPKVASHVVEPDAVEAEAAKAEEAEAAKAEEVASETAKPAKAALGAYPIRVIPIVRSSAPAADAPDPLESVSAADERKDASNKDASKETRGANELARAAIRRLRGGSENQRAAEELPKPVAAATHSPQARLAVEMPQALPAMMVTSAPPLPPAVTIAGPRYPQADAADMATQPERLTPPGEIPTAERQPLTLQASHRVAENPSFADDVLSATKSFFRAITPP